MTLRRRADRASRRVRRSLARADQQLLLAATRGRGPSTDRIMRSASTLANRSLLWLVAAFGLAATGKRADKAAAAGGLLGIAIAATLANGPLKFAWRRQRPPLLSGDAAPLLPLPHTFSFPSGHSASAFAFATGVSRALPAAAPMVIPAAATVAYSRVHTGVHYPSDVLVGSAVGVASGLVGAAIVRRRQGAAHRIDAPSLDVGVPRNAILLTSKGSGSAGELGAARAALDAAGFTVTAQLAVQDAERLPGLVNDASGQVLVLAAGGDGTAGAAAAAVTHTDAVLGVLPLGTSNDIARSLGLPIDPAETVRAIAGGRVVAVDAAELVDTDGRTRVFLHAATMGLNVAFAELATDTSIRDRFGGITYPVAAARAVRHYEPFSCTIEHEGRRETVQLVHLSVGNAPVFGGVLGMRAPGASMVDGQLDVLLVERLSRTRLALAVGDTLVGRHHPVRRVHTRRVTSIRVETPTDQEVAVDGEVAARPPVEFRVLPGAVRVAVPALPV